VRQDSADSRELKADVAGLKVAVADPQEGLERVEGKVDGLGPLEARVTALARDR